MSALALARSGCGGVAVTLGEAELLLRASGVLWLGRARTLVAADLHLEKGSAYARKGQLLPPYDTADTLGRLAAEVAALDPVVVVLLGDSFHDGEGEARMAPRDTQRLEAIAARRRLIWVVGNHDADGPKALPGEVVPDIRIEGVVFRHEPIAGPQTGEAAGHLHPCLRVAGRGGKVRRRCFVTDGARIVLPAFGAFAGGQNVRDAAFSTLFARPPLAVALGPDRAQPIGWDMLVGD
ncbi:MAG TPA: ligase-associated DNA damage response endonuclease PdeM [Caulobacteraceae bacterium]|nr:ligase-associated DNA damage response endonuclease PdeM [Caulobacteraceae bacterium]